MPESLDIEVALILKYASGIGPDDPRRQNMKGHVDNAKTEISNYRCKPADDPTPPARPNPPGSEGAGLGFDKMFDKARRQRSSTTRPGGRGGRTSAINRKCINSLIRSGKTKVRVARSLFALSNFYL